MMVRSVLGVAISVTMFIIQDPESVLYDVQKELGAIWLRVVAIGHVQVGQLIQKQ